MENCHKGLEELGVVFIKDLGVMKYVGVMSEFHKGFDELRMIFELGMIFIKDLRS